MSNPINLLLIPLLSALLVTAQAIWGTAIKQHHLMEGSAGKILNNLITSPRIWAGGIIYVIATGIYFVLLSKNKFFSVQVTMTALAIIFSTALAAIIFHEKLSAYNLVGAGLVMLGLVFVLAK